MVSINQRYCSNLLLNAAKFALPLSSSRRFRPLDRSMSPETCSLIVSIEIDRSCFFSLFLSLFFPPSTRPRPRTFSILSHFSFAADVFIIARVPADRNPAKAPASGYAALVLLSLDQRTVKIFSRILGGSPTGAKTADVAFSSRALL